MTENVSFQKQDFYGYQSRDYRLQQITINRLHTNKSTNDKCGDFVRLAASESDARQVHTSIAPNHDFRDNADQFQEIKDFDVAKGTQTQMNILRGICQKVQDEKCYRDVIKVLAHGFGFKISFCRLSKASLYA